MLAFDERSVSGDFPSADWLPMLRMLGEMFDETHLWDLNSCGSKNLIRSGSIYAYAWGGSVCGITSGRGGTELTSVSCRRLKL